MRVLAPLEPKQETAILGCADCARCLLQSLQMLGVGDGAAACRRAVPRSATVLLWISGRADRAVPGASRLRAEEPRQNRRMGSRDYGSYP